MSPPPFTLSFPPHSPLSSPGSGSRLQGVSLSSHVDIFSHRPDDPRKIFPKETQGQGDKGVSAASRLNKAVGIMGTLKIRASSQMGEESAMLADMEEARKREKELEK